MSDMNRASPERAETGSTKPTLDEVVAWVADQLRWERRLTELMNASTAPAPAPAPVAAAPAPPDRYRQEAIAS
jgi:hypothetical protein